jgi:hypothetical protein
MILLGPVPPADAIALMPPDALAHAFDIANLLDGQLRPEHRQDGPEEEDGAPVLVAAFEEALRQPSARRTRRDKRGRRPGGQHLRRRPKRPDAAPDDAVAEPRPRDLS